MARVTSEKIGRGPCPSRHCDDLVMFRKSSGGMLTHKCEGCGSSGYAMPGDHAHAARMASITAHAAPAAPAAPAVQAATAAPAAKAPAKNSIFSMGDL